MFSSSGNRFSAGKIVSSPSPSEPSAVDNQTVSEEQSPPSKKVTDQNSFVETSASRVSTPLSEKVYIIPEGYNADPSGFKNVKAKLQAKNPKQAQTNMTQQPVEHHDSNNIHLLDDIPGLSVNLSSDSSRSPLGILRRERHKKIVSVPGDPTENMLIEVFQHMNGKIHTFEKKLDEKTSEIKRLKGQLEKGEKKQSDEQEKLTLLETNAKKYKQMAADLQKKLDGALFGDSSKLKSEIASLKDQNAKLQEKLDNNLETLSEKDAEIEKLKSDKSSLKSENIKYESENDRLKTRVKELEDKMEELKLSMKSRDNESQDRSIKTEEFKPTTNPTFVSRPSQDQGIPDISSKPGTTHLDYSSAKSYQTQQQTNSMPGPRAHENHQSWHEQGNINYQSSHNSPTFGSNATDTYHTGPIQNPPSHIYQQQMPLTNTPNNTANHHASMQQTLSNTHSSSGYPNNSSQMPRGTSDGLRHNPAPYVDHPTSNPTGYTNNSATKNAGNTVPSLQKPVNELGSLKLSELLDGFKSYLNSQETNETSVGSESKRAQENRLPRDIDDESNDDDELEQVRQAVESLAAKREQQKKKKALHSETQPGLEENRKQSNRFNGEKIRTSKSMDKVPTLFDRITTEVGSQCKICFAGSSYPCQHQSPGYENSNSNRKPQSFSRPHKRGNSSENWDEEDSVRPSMPPEEAANLIVEKLSKELEDLNTEYRNLFDRYDELDPSKDLHKRRSLAQKLKSMVNRIENKADQLYAMRDVMLATDLKDPSDDEDIRGRSSSRYGPHHSQDNLLGKHQWIRA